MYFVDRIDVPGLGNRGYLAGGPHRTVAIDPPHASSVSSRPSGPPRASSRC
jgi:hypothetical protein